MNPTMTSVFDLSPAEKLQLVEGWCCKFSIAESTGSTFSSESGGVGQRTDF